MKKGENKKENLMSIADYAKACNGTPAAIYLRLKKKKIKGKKISNGEYEALVIDANIYPPIPIKRGRKAFKAA